MIDDLYVLSQKSLLNKTNIITRIDNTKLLCNENILDNKEFGNNLKLWRQPISGRFICAANSNKVIEFGSTEYFLYCSMGGIVSCGSTHTLLTPLDLVKCRLQVDHEKYKSIANGFKVTINEGGMRGLVKGWAPTFFGYALQGCFKFGFYEFFKVKYSNMMSEESSHNFRTYIYLVSAASAEFIADIFLCPFEAMKVKIQTTQGYADNMRECFGKMIGESGPSVFYKGLVPLWLRQIPYTTMKFTSFEKTIEVLYKHVVKKTQEQCSKSEQLVITFAGGYIAGVFCAIVSHPADVIVSKLNQSANASVGSLIQKLGFFGLWGGLAPRIIMIGTLTALQWFIYDGFKVMMEMPRPTTKH